jgi:hypothetical protein
MPFRVAKIDLVEQMRVLLANVVEEGGNGGTG